MPKVKVKSNLVFEIFISDVETAYDTLMSDVENSIDRMRATGMGDVEIAKRLKFDLSGNTGAFQSFKSQLSGSFNDLISTSSQIESNDLIKDSADLFLWALDPTAKEHCSTCLTNSKKNAMSWDDWENIGIPGAGNTDCGAYCKCTLVGAE